MDHRGRHVGAGRGNWGYCDCTEEDEAELLLEAEQGNVVRQEEEEKEFEKEEEEEEEVFNEVVIPASQDPEEFVRYVPV